MHLAQFNYSRWKIDPDSEEAKFFWDNVDLMNGLAERTEGFVWRLLDDPRDENGANVICPDPETIFTLSVWETPEHLEKYVWNTVHKQIYRQKNRWFGKMETHHFFMWWVEKGHRPGLEEAKKRWDYLNVNGNSDYAFEWSHLPNVKLWQKQRCG